MPTWEEHSRERGEQSAMPRGWETRCWQRAVGSRGEAWEPRADGGGACGQVDPSGFSSTGNKWPQEGSSGQVA